MEKRFLPYAHQSIDDSDIQAVAESLKQDWITRGPNVERFEQEIAEFCGAKHAIAFNSATSALMGAYYAAGMGPADRLITTPNTFVATVGPAVLLGTTPVFIDIDLSTGNLDLQQLEPNLDYRSSRGKIFIAPVHYAGVAVDMQKLWHLASRKNAIIIEDAAHALGAFYPSGERVGCCKYSDMAVFSFHPAKHITTGEGGMVVTNDDAFAHGIRKYRNNGIVREAPFLESGLEAIWYYEVQAITGNFHMNEMQAALGRSQFKRLNQFLKKRLQLVKHYRSLLQGTPHLTMMTDRYDEKAAFHLFVVCIDFPKAKTDRNRFMQSLREVGIGTQLHYIPIYAHPYFQKRYGDIAQYFPNMERFFAQAVTLPLYFDLTFEEVDYIAKKIKELLV